MESSKSEQHMLTLVRSILDPSDAEPPVFSAHTTFFFFFSVYRDNIICSKLLTLILVVI